MARKQRGNYTTENEWQAELGRTRTPSGVMNMEPLPAAPVAPAFGGGISRGTGASRSFGPLAPEPTTAPAAPQGAMPPTGFVRGVVENNPVMAPITERATAIDNAPRLFVDSDGRARAGYNMGQEGRELGLVPADRGGVPEGIQMMPVSGLSQGSMSIGRDLAAGPPAPVALRPEELPVAPGVANERYGRAVGAMGGFVAPPMNAREQARAADMDATRAARWDQRGPTTGVDRAVGQIRSQGAALDALNRQTDAQIRGAQGTPQGLAGAAGNSTWDPVGRKWSSEMRPADQPGAEDLVDQVTGMKLSDITKAHAKAKFGAKEDPMYRIAMVGARTPEEREMVERQYGADQAQAVYWADALRRMGRNPDQVAQGTEKPAPGAGGVQPGPGVNAGTQNGMRATGSVADKYRRKAK